MMKKAILCATLMGALQGAAAEPLPAGTLITATASGAATGMLGLDHLFADEPGSETTALAAADLEYLSNDYAMAVDFFTDGRINFHANTDATQLPGSYTLSFSFAGLTQPLAGFTLSDTSGLSAGTITPLLLDGNRISISFSELSFSDSYGSFSAQLSLLAVPEPGSFALFGAGLLLLAGLRRAGRAA